MTRNLTIFAAILLIVSLLVALGNADDLTVESPSDAAQPTTRSTPDQFILSDTVGTGTLNRATELSNPVSQETVSVLAQRTTVLASESSPTDTEPSSSPPIISEPLKFSPPAQIEPAATIQDNPAGSADEFPLVTGVVSAKDKQTPAPIVVADKEDLEFELYSEQGNQRTPLLPALLDSHPQAHSIGSDGGLRTQLGQIPRVQVMTRIPQTLRTDQASVFEIIAVNQGEQQVEDVFLVTALPEWIELTNNDTTHGTVEVTDNGAGTDLQWQVGKLAAGARAIWRMTVTAKDNRAFQLATRWTVQPLGLATDIAVIQPELQLSLDGPQEMIYGQTKIFSVRVTNTGNGNAKDIVLRVSPGVEAGQSIGQLAAGGSKLIELELTAEQAGEMTIAASVSAEGSDLAEKELEIRIRRPELAIKVVGPASKFAGTPVKYQIEVTNSGDTTAQNVVVAAMLPKGAQYIQNGKQIPNGRRNMSWNIGAVEVAASRTFEFECILIQEGDNPLTVRVEALAAESRSAATTTRVQGLADLKLIVNDPPGPKQLDELAVYEIHVINRGTRPAYGVDVIAQFGYGVEPVKAEGQTAELIPGQVIFDAIDSIAPGEKMVLKVYARADREGRHKFRVKLTGRDPETTLVQEEMTWFLESVTGDGGPTILEANGAQR